MSGLVSSLQNLLFALAVGLVAGLGHGALLWHQVQGVTWHGTYAAGRVAAGSLLRTVGVSFLLVLGARLGLASSIAALAGFWAARAWWMRRILV